MKTNNAVKNFLDYHKTNSKKKNTYRNYSYVLGYFQVEFGDREMEVAFIPQKISDRLKEYIQVAQLPPDSKIFPISYTAAWSIVVNSLPTH